MISSNLAGIASMPALFLIACALSQGLPIQEAEVRANALLTSFATEAISLPTIVLMLSLMTSL